MNPTVEVLKQRMAEERAKQAGMTKDELERYKFEKSFKKYKEGLDTSNDEPSPILTEEQKEKKAEEKRAVAQRAKEKLMEMKKNLPPAEKKPRAPTPPHKKSIFDLTPREKAERDVQEYIDIAKGFGVRGKKLAEKVAEYKKKKGYDF